jgi:hypothetical protein
VHSGSSVPNIGVHFPRTWREELITRPQYSGGDVFIIRRYRYRYRCQQDLPCLVLDAQNQIQNQFYFRAGVTKTLNQLWATTGDREVAKPTVILAPNLFRTGGQCFIYGALCPFKSGLLHKHVGKHIAVHLMCNSASSLHSV